MARVEGGLASQNPTSHSTIQSCLTPPRLQVRVLKMGPSETAGVGPQIRDPAITVAVGEHLQDSWLDSGGRKKKPEDSEAESGGVLLVGYLHSFSLQPCLLINHFKAGKMDLKEKEST